jgi:hypothetical protein
MRDLRYTFSVDLKSKKHVKNISISDEAYDRVLFEGDLGCLVSLSLLDGRMLELEGENGVLRTTMSEDLLQRVLSKPDRVLCLSSEMGSVTSTEKKEVKK